MFSLGRKPQGRAQKKDMSPWRGRQKNLYGEGQISVSSKPAGGCGIRR
jgi:hypothetical protein